MWATFPDYFDPRLVLAAPWINNESQLNNYSALDEVIGQTGFSSYRMPDLLILRMNDPFIQELRAAYGGKPVEGMRLRGRFIAGRYLEDGYVYNID